jgi:hypothetical protein
MITLRFSTSTERSSMVIRRMLHSPFSHVDAVMDDGSMLGASDQGPTSPVIVGTPQGVAIRPADYQIFGIRRDMLLEAGGDVTNLFYNALLSQLGKPFDHSAMWEFLSADFDRNWQQDDMWFCSELMAWALERAGFWGGTAIPWPKSRISPSDLQMVLLMDRRWVNRDTFWEGSGS